MNEEEEIQIAHLPAHLHHCSLPVAGSMMGVPDMPLNKAVRNMEMQMLQQALKRTAVPARPLPH